MKRLRAWLCRHGIHRWKMFTVLGWKKDMWYFCRRCSCGRVQIQGQSWAARGRWRDVNDVWKNEWEQEDFQRGTEKPIT